MSFGDLYTVQPGQGNPPGLPPVDLPRVTPPPRSRLKIEVRPAPAAEGIWGAVEDFKPSAASGKPTAEEGVWGALPDHSSETEAAAKKSYRDVGMGEAFARSAGQGASFGLEPAIEGAVAAGRTGENPKGVEPEPGWADAITGLVRMGYEHFLSPEGKATQAYRKAREEAQAALQAGREQHPVASFAGEMTGALAVPVPGLAAAAAPARFARGAAFGAAGGGAYGVGSGISEGKDAAGIAKQGLIDAGLGFGTGGVFGAALGPRAAAAVPGRGERAAETARQLGAPIPRGLASDNPAVNSATAAMRSVPILGSRVSSAVDATQQAAGEHMGDIAAQMFGGAPSRAVGDTLAKTGLQSVIDANRTRIDANYDAVRNAIDQGQHFIMPRTQAVLSQIMRARYAAGHPKPDNGLDQFINVSQGATFNGAHRARVDAREAGNPLVPHPGYNAEDYNKLTKAMTVDLRDMAAAATKGMAGRPATRAQQVATVRAFDDAEKEFGRLADQNGLLHKLVNSQGQASIEKLLGAAQERHGNLPLLAQLRQTMPPSEFEVIGGTILHELGQSPATKEFSLAHFTTGWNKLSDGAKRALFSPQHLKDIDDIAGLGSQIKRALRESNTSHTANVLIWFDLARDGILLAASGVAGTIGTGTIAGAALGAPGVLMMRWLSSPAKASAMAKWSRARIGMINHPTPARLAAFNLATRNLSNNLGVPVQSILKRIASPPKAGDTEDK